MASLVEIASPLEIASLWRLNFLCGDDLSAICLRWLEEDLDKGDPDIGAFAGQPQLTVSVSAVGFERALASLVGRSIDENEAILRALRLHLAAALTGDLMKGVAEVIHRFGSLSDQRLVHNPRRSRDHPDGVYAEQELGLEYVYSGFYAFDDIWHLSVDEQKLAEAELLQDLRNAVAELEAHLTAMLLGESGPVTRD